MNPANHVLNHEKPIRKYGSQEAAQEFGWRRPRDPTVGDASRGAETPPFYLPVTKVAGGWIPGFDWQGSQSAGLIFIYLAELSSFDDPEFCGEVARRPAPHFLRKLSTPDFAGWLIGGARNPWGPEISVHHNSGLSQQRVVTTAGCHDSGLSRSAEPSQNNGFWLNQVLSFGTVTHYPSEPLPPVTR